jgi:hypothetical protein
LSGRALPAGHFLAEELPTETAQQLMAFFKVGAEGGAARPGLLQPSAHKAASARSRSPVAAGEFADEAHFEKF